MTAKLVRDKVPELIKKDGPEPIFHIAGKREYRRLLFEKLEEEVEEFIENPSKEEFIDVDEVLWAIAELLFCKEFDDEGFWVDELQRARDQKAERKGRFDDRVVLDKIRAPRKRRRHAISAC